MCSVTRARAVGARLDHEGGLGAPSWFNNIIGTFWPIAP